MFDIDEIMRRAEAARDAASQQLSESMDKSRKLAEQMQGDAERAQAEREAEQRKAADPAAG